MSIGHQGSLYAATPFAAPFLARLALDPATPDRELVVGLLAFLVASAVSPTSADVDAARAVLDAVRPYRTALESLDDGTAGLARAVADLRAALHRAPGARRLLN
jgi:hypothetical protein